VPPPAKGMVGQLVAFVRRFPVGASVGTLAAVVAIIGGGIGIYDRFFKPIAVDVDYIESAFAAPTEGAMLMVDADRLFSGGFRARVQLALKAPAPYAVINSIALRPVSTIPDAVVTRAKAGIPAERQDPAWAGSRQIETYYAVLEPDGIRVAFNNREGKPIPCPAENLLDCEGAPRVVELNANGDTTHTLDLQVLYRGISVQGVNVVVAYAMDGVRGVAEAQALYVFN
jgi:hypothetical protein